MRMPRTVLLLAWAALGTAWGEPSAAQEPPMDEALRAAPSGLCVLLGAGDATTAVRLAEGGRRLVHVLEADETKVALARTLLAARGLAGLASVESWSAEALPYPENLVNLLIGATAPADAELLRVLAPGGTALVRRNGAWTTLRKPRPAAFSRPTWECHPMQRSPKIYARHHSSLRQPRWIWVRL